MISWKVIILITSLSSVQSEEIPLFDWTVVESHVQEVVKRCPQDVGWQCDGKRSFRACHCDEDCIRYGDCCLDKAKETIHSRSSSLKYSWKCLLFASGRLQNMYMITKCPENFQDDTVRSKCIKTDQPHTYHMDLPVSHQDNHYQNIFCAICNEVPIKSLKVAASIITCNNMDVINSCGLDVLDHVVNDENYVSGSLSWKLHLPFDHDLNNCSDQTYFITCRLILDKLTDHKRTRCLPDPSGTGVVIDSCRESEVIATAKDQADHLQSPARRKRDVIQLDRARLYCGLYSYFVTYNGVIFRNPHCAICNGVDANDTICLAQDQGVKPFNTNPYPTVEIALNFTHAAPETLEDYYDPVEPSPPACGQDQFYDPIYNNCYNIHCGFLYQNVAGRCAFRNITEAETADNGEECFKVSLNPWQLR